MLDTLQELLECIAAGRGELKHWIDLTGHELAELPEQTVVVCPLGAVESHGPHLPSGTDAILADAILDRLSGTDDVSALRLPTVWLGASPEHGTRAGTITTTASGLIAQIDAVAESLARQGVVRLILFNAHGGNTPASRAVAMAARAEHGMLCAAVHWMDFGLPEGLEPPAPVRADVHGGWLETSMMLAVAPAKVRRPLPGGDDQAKAPTPMLFPEGAIHWGWMSEDLGHDGYIGRPDLATAELGDQLITHVAASLGQLIGQLSHAEWPAG